MSTPFGATSAGRDGASRRSAAASASETQTALAHAQKHKELRRGLEDVLWSLLNTREFLFNH